MELSHLKYACVLAREHNFSRAAEKLFISQPTLSQQIGRLEHELGLKLFIRTTHTVELTPQGELFVRKAQRVLEEFDELTQIMLDVANSDKSVCMIGMMPSFSAYGIPEVLTSFHRKYPKIETKLTMEWSGQLVEKLQKHEIDIAFLNVDDDMLSAFPDNIQIEPFLDDQLMLITGESSFMYSSETADISSLSEMPFLAPPRESSIQQLLEKLFQEHHITPNIVCVCTTIESLINLARANVGVTIMSSGVARQYGGIRMIPLKPAYHLKTCVAYDQSLMRSPAKRLFLNYLFGKDN